MMRSSKKWTLSLVAVLTAAFSLLLSACGSSSAPRAPMPSSASYAAAAAAPAAAPRDFQRNEADSLQQLATDEMSPETGGGGFSGKVLAGESKPVDSAANSVSPPAAEQPRKLIRDSDLQLETKEFDAALEALSKMFAEAGGYVDNQSVDGKSLRYSDNSYERSATITARIPADKLDSVTKQIGTLCNIISQSESVSDITENYYDAQSRLDVLKVKETRLLELLAKAEKLEDIIKLEDALSNCQYEMDSLTGQLRRMDSRVSYSTLSIRLNEVVEYRDVKAPPATFGEKLASSASYSWKRLGRSMESTLLGVIENGPVLLFNLVIWGGILYLIYYFFFRKRLHPRRKKAPVPPSGMAPPVETPPPPEEPHIDNE